MNVAVNIDSTQLVLRMRNGEKRVKYAVVNALKKTALQIQTAEQDNVRKRFIIRKEAFFFGSPARPGGAAARISPFASVSQPSPYTEIAAGASTLSGNRRLLLSEFEAGGTRRPFTPGAKNVAVPLLGRPAHPSIRQGVPPQYTFAGLRFKAYKAGRKAAIPRRTTRTGALSLFDEFGRRRDLSSFGKVQWKGLERTFILPATQGAPHGGVFQRIGPGRGDIRMIYAFKPSFQLDARLHFVDTAEVTARAHFQEYLDLEILDVLARHGVPA